MSSWTQTAEVVGLLLARWLLEHTGALAGRVVVPLDAHRSWFGNGGADRSQQRADLLLVLAGQASAAIRELPAAELVETLVRETEDAVRRLAER